MGNKLEKIYEHLTGVDPDSLEPKPTGLQIAKAIKALRSGYPLIPVLPKFCDPHYEVVETNLMIAAHGDPSRPYSVIRRTSPNGVQQFSFLWGVSLSPEDVAKAGASQLESNWFELSDSCQL